METPRWIKILRILALLGLPIMVFNCFYARSHDRPEFDELLPCTMVLAACLHLLMRAPFRRWRYWEAPLIVGSVALAGVGAFLFTPNDEDRETAFQVFFGVFVGLAVGYGFFCSAVADGHPLRKSVIEPTKRVSHMGVIGYDIGLVAAPFAFLFFLFRALLRRRPST